MAENMEFQHSQLQNFDQWHSWFSSRANVPTSQFTRHLAFYGQQQQHTQQPFSGYHGNSQKFTSTKRGFQAQQPRNQNHNFSNNPTSSTQQNRIPPPGERHMTSAERNLYREKQCQVGK